MRTDTGARTGNNDAEVVTASPLAVRYETLVRVSRAVGANGDLKELLCVLVNELRGVVEFDVVGVSLRDEDSDTFQNYFIDMTGLSELVPDEKLAPEETRTLRVYERQETLVRSGDEMEQCNGRLQPILKELDIRSICVLPLTTAHRKLGVITFGSKQVDTYSPNEIGFVSQVVDYIALAFDGALNFASLRRASEELRRKNDRLRLLLDVTNQVVSNLDPVSYTHLSIPIARIRGTSITWLAGFDPTLPLRRLRRSWRSSPINSVQTTRTSWTSPKPWVSFRCGLPSAARCVSRF